MFEHSVWIKWLTRANFLFLGEEGTKRIPAKDAARMMEFGNRHLAICNRRRRQRLSTTAKIMRGKVSERARLISPNSNGQLPIFLEAAQQRWPLGRDAAAHTGRPGLQPQLCSSSQLPATAGTSWEVAGIFALVASLPLTWVGDLD